jgi:hypothetical protein|nr:hypothetical protein [uncultured Capnocytophaga sp.]
MAATTIQATINNVDFPMIQQLFERLKIKTIILDEKEDDTLMSKEAFFAMVDKSRASKEVRINREEMRQRLLK